MEEEGDVVALAIGHRYGRCFPDGLLGFHQWEADPWVGARYEFTEEFDIESHGVTLGAVLAVIADLDVVYGVGIQVVQFFIVHLGGHLEVPVYGTERIISSQYEMDGALWL